jgi:hypothetical protein
VVTLIEDHELELLRVSNLGKEVRRRRMSWFHLSIADVSWRLFRFAGFKIGGWTVSQSALDDLTNFGTYVAHSRLLLSHVPAAYPRLALCKATIGTWLSGAAAPS